MAEPVIPVRAKLFVGMISGDERLIYTAEEKLKKKFGPVDVRSASIPFTHTKYYQKIGTILFRVFISFDKLIKREDIVKAKLFTNDLEKSLSPKGARKINIDPGYLTLSNVYLASCKEYFHRCYLEKGIYLENEYKFIDRRYIPWEWTYPDYQKTEYLEYFHRLRGVYYMQIKNEL
jgi:hypothetical protein